MREFFWPTVTRDCAKYVAQCLSCAAVRPAVESRTRPLQLFPPSGPWEFVCADILGPLPVSPDGNRFVLVFSDRFSKFTVAVAMKTVTANDVAEKFVADWVAYFGVPLVLLTDNGPQFASKFLQQVSAVLGVQQRFTNAYHPATNGQVERFNRTLLGMLAHYTSENRSWDKTLGPVMAAYNSTVHTSTGFAPQEFIRAQVHRILRPKAPVFAPPEKGAWRRDFMRRIALIGAQAKESLAKAQERYKRCYDAHVRLRNSQITAGEYVLIRVYADSPKLTLPLAGPFRVIRVDARNGTYVVATREGPVRVSGDRVRPAPMPRDFPAEVKLLPPPVECSTETPDTTQYVIDRIISHGRNEDGEAIARIRWAGYNDDDDTWERCIDLPHEVIQKYARRKRVSIESLLR
jgi:Integrase core domain